MKPKMRLIVGAAAHFLAWESPFFERRFELVEEASSDAILFAFGPDVFGSSAHVPALRRVAMLFPGFRFHPYHNAEQRREALALIDSCYDLVLVNPGPVREALRSSDKVVACPFSVDAQGLPFRPREAVNSLLHVSAASPQKDWQRSKEIMARTGLRYEVFPPRGRQPLSFSRRVKNLLNRCSAALGRSGSFPPIPAGYVEHRLVVRKYQQYDGFVHVAAEHPRYEDGKYTATLLEAGLTGAILFWHDTLGLGNDFETIFDLPLEPVAAADAILRLREALDAPRHSQRTHDEILDKCGAEKAVAFKCEKIEELL